MVVLISHVRARQVIMIAERVGWPSGRYRDTLGRAKNLDDVAHARATVRHRVATQESQMENISPVLDVSCSCGCDERIQRFDDVAIRIHVESPHEVQ